jgi:hypothetical protein
MAGLAQAQQVLVAVGLVVILLELLEQLILAAAVAVVLTVQ